MPENEEPKANGQPPSVAITPQMAAHVAATSAIGAQANLLLSVGVPLQGVINMLFEVGCNLIASIEPRETRDLVINEIRRNLPDAVRQQYDARHTRPSGLVVPGKITRQ